MRISAPLCLLWLVFTATVPLQASEPPPTTDAAPVATSPPIDADAAGIVRELLQTGFRGRNADQAMIERIVSADAPGDSRDSRTDYAHGLVLLRHLKHHEAIAAFERGTAARPPYLPGWQALIRTHLVLSEVDPALAHAERLATQLADADVAWVDEKVREQGAEWLGRLAGYLSLEGVDAVDPPALLTAGSRWGIRCAPPGSGAARMFIASTSNCSSSGRKHGPRSPPANSNSTKPVPARSMPARSSSTNRPKHCR
jgi:hypothetical protein